jgi:hypothetical protein
MILRREERSSDGFRSKDMALTAYHYFCADAMEVAEERFSASLDDEVF